jgi:hypothetical protein
MTKSTHSTAAVLNPDAAVVSDLLRRAIKRHEAAYAFLDSACYLSDRGILGREPTAEEHSAYKNASDAEANALSDVCYFPAATVEDLAAKARHLRQYHCDRRGYLESWQVENLLRSMLPETEHDEHEDAEGVEGGAA